MTFHVPSLCRSTVARHNRRPPGFRGWLLTQGREVFERAVADPDTLADLPVVQRVAADGGDLECESMYGVVWDANAAVAAGMQPPAVTGRYPLLGQGWDFEDAAEVRRRLPRLAALFAG